MSTPYRFNFAINEKMAERNRLILALSSTGMTNAAIARASGLSAAVVGRVIHNGSFAATAI